MNEINPFLLNLGSSLLAAAFAAGGAWFAVKTELRYMRRDIDENKRELDRVEERRHADAELLHDRINRLAERVNGRHHD